MIVSQALQRIRAGRFALIGILIASTIAFVSSCRSDDSDPDIGTLLSATVLAQAAACNASLARTQAGRSFTTSFEAVSDFDGFYLVPQNYQNAASHELSTAQVRTGTNSHRGYITAQGPDCGAFANCNHRGYPTVQLHKTAQGGFRTPVLVEFYSYLDMSVPDQRWFSFATFTSDSSDNWARTVLVNLGNLNTGTTNYMHLFHVPTQSRGDWSYQTSDAQSPLAYPSNQWVKVSVCLDFDSTSGNARVFQDGTLVSSAAVQGTCGVLEQAHFGLYAHPGLSSGSVYNDDLSITEVAACPF
ncbi:MAG: polysaccharide lyase [bacterium]|nr:polysaccharide lyase [bacterium]